MPLTHPNTLCDRLAKKLPPLPPGRLAVAAWGGMAGATVLIGLGHGWAAAPLLLLALLADGLAQAMARKQGAVMMAATPLALLLVPFGFALHDPSRALAAMFLLLSLCLFTTQRLMAGRTGLRWLHWLAALGLVVACLLPDRFSLLAYLIGIACFISAGQGLAQERIKP